MGLHEEFPQLIVKCLFPWSKLMIKPATAAIENLPLCSVFLTFITYYNVAYTNIFQSSSSLLLTSFALLRTRTFSASPQKKSSPSLLVAVAMTTAINLIVLLLSTPDCLNSLNLYPLCPAFNIIFHYKARGLPTNPYTKRVMQPHYVWEISFVLNAVSLYFLVMKMLSGGHHLLTAVTCGHRASLISDRVNYPFTEGWITFQ